MGTDLTSAAFWSQENPILSAQQGMAPKEPLGGRNGWSGFYQLTGEHSPQNEVTVLSQGVT